METAAKARVTGAGAGDGAAEKGKLSPSHRAVAVFVALDLAFLLAFLGFLFYFVFFQIPALAASSSFAA